MADEIGAGPVDVKIGVRHGDGLQNGAALLGEARLEHGKVAGPVALAHGFDHLDGDDVIIGALGVAIVAKLDAGAAIKAGVGIAFLRLGNGDACHIAARLGGALGAFVPFASKDEADFCTHLEMHLRIEAPPVLGNEHGAFRSSYFPVKAVVDGDLCEQFGRLGADAQRRISEEMDRTPSEIVKRLEQIRARAG